MIKEIIHVGITVTDINKSIDFYQNILGLSFKGKILMEGEATDRLFNKKNCKVIVAYLNGSEDISSPPVELLQFLDNQTNVKKSDLFTTSISEICFKVDDIDLLYKKLINNKVECISEPQEFDFTKEGFGKSKAIYFKDPDGIILEAMEYI